MAAAPAGVPQPGRLLWVRRQEDFVAALRLGVLAGVARNGVACLAFQRCRGDTIGEAQRLAELLMLPTAQEAAAEHMMAGVYNTVPHFSGCVPGSIST